MRTLIFADIEGMVSMFHLEQTRAGSGKYECARHWMTTEADATVRGAFDGGVTDVLVNDSHGGFRDLIPDSIDRRACLALGKPRYLSMMAGVDGRDVVCMAGYHAHAGSRSVLAHTINSFTFAHIWFNGQELDEAGLYGALAGERDVPVAAANGDDVFVKETKPLLSYATLVEIKQAEGQNAGTSLPPERSRETIYVTAKATVRRGHSSMPLRLRAPIVCCLQT